MPVKLALAVKASPGSWEPKRQVPAAIRSQKRSFFLSIEASEVRFERLEFLFVAIEQLLDPLSVPLVIKAS